jgi:hypothetical protein
MVCTNPLKSIIRGSIGYIRKIALATQMAKVQVAQICGHELFNGIGSGVIREMAVPA